MTKDNGGFGSAAELRERVERYFHQREAEGRPPTVCGLAEALGFPSRMALLNFKGRAVYGRIIDRALLAIEKHNEELLYTKEGASGAKLVLQTTFPGWKEGRETQAAAPEDDGVMAEIRARLETGG